MSLNTILAAVVDTLTPVFAPTPVEIHGGRFTEREVPALLAKAPCVLVACMGVNRLDPFAGAAWQGQVQLAVYAFGADVVGQARGPLAMDLAQTVLQQLLPDQYWGLTADQCEPPDWTSATAENLYSGHVNILQVSIWAVTWNQLFFFP